MIKSKIDFHLLVQFLFSSRASSDCDLDLVMLWNLDCCGNQRSVDIARLYAPAPPPPPHPPAPPLHPWSWFMTCRGWSWQRLRLVWDSYYFPCLLLLCPLQIDDMVSPSYVICHCTFVKICFRWLSIWPGVYLWRIFWHFLMLSQSRVEFSARFTYNFNSQLYHENSYTIPQVFSFSSLSFGLKLSSRVMWSHRYWLLETKNIQKNGNRRLGFIKFHHI